MSKLVFTDKCPDVVMVQFLNGRINDFSKFSSRDEAWEEEKNRPWVQKYVGHPENAKKEFINSLKVFTKRQLLEETALQISQLQRPWAMEIGFIADTKELEWKAKQAQAEATKKAQADAAKQQEQHTNICIEMPTYALSADRLLAQSTVIRDGVHQRVTLDQLQTGETVYPDPELKIPLPMVVVDNLPQFTPDLTEDDAAHLVQAKVPKYVTAPPINQRSQDIDVPIRGVAQRMALHRQYGLSHQLLTTVAGGNPAWINVTGMSVQQPAQNPDKEMAAFATQFYGDFRLKMLSAAEVVNVKVEDFKDAKSHMGDMTRDYHSCANHQEKKAWLLRAEKNLLKYRGYDCPRMKDRDENMSTYRDVMNKLISQMGVCVSALSEPEAPKVKRSLEDLPPESQRLLNIGKGRDNDSDLSM